jgi:hypothetical protein
VHRRVVANKKTVPIIARVAADKAVGRSIGIWLMRTLVAAGTEQFIGFPITAAMPAHWRTSKCSGGKVGHGGRMSELWVRSASGDIEY